jgi:hypothetical protein
MHAIPLTFAVGGYLMIRAGDMPLFITATERIRWSSIPGMVRDERTGSVGRRGPLDDHQTRPAWLDDPSAPLPGGIR